MKLPLVCLALVATFAMVSVAHTQSPKEPSIQISSSNRTLSVSASDHAEVDAEIAELHVGYTVYGATLQTAYKTASDTSNVIMQAMLGAGAKRSDIQSGLQDVTRLGATEIKDQKGARYRISQTWTIALAPKDAALVLDAAVQAGANETGRINWRLKSSVALDAEAVRRATERAHAIAIELAKGAGATLGKALYATNSVSSGIATPRLMSNFSDGFTGGLARQAPAPLAIEPQRVESQATVQIVYALE
ncbi:MAG TPA: SIMPL domain-containing protein [Acidobacteriaceae bacterium]|jgi:hypothetical protein